MRILTILKSIITLPWAVLKWMESNIVAPQNHDQPLPPIRYDGDPNEIYLA